MLTKTFKLQQKESSVCECILVKAQHPRIRSSTVFAQYSSCDLYLFGDGRKIWETGLTESAAYFRQAGKRGLPALFAQ